MIGMDKLVVGLFEDRKKLALAGLAVFILFFLDFTFVAKPQLKAISRDSAKVAKLRQDTAGLNNDLLKFEAIKAKGASLLKSLKGPIQEEELPDLLEQISGLANDNNIRIMQIQPFKDSRVKESQVQKEQLNSKPLLIEIDMLSGYHNLGAFLSGMEGLSAPLVVDKFNMQSDNANPMQHKVELVLRTYVKK